MKFLVVTAHPDDESYGPGGTLARYAYYGHAIYLLTFTRGEAGTLGPCATLPDEQVAEMRSRELACAVQVLGLRELILLNYPDGRLRELPESEALNLLDEHVRRIEPDIVLTFHSEGVTRHPDHMAVSRWCDLFFQQQRPRARLLQFGISLQQAQLIKNRTLYPIPEDQITHRIDVGEFLEVKKQAIQCHQSQLELWERVQQVEGGYDAMARFEHFRQVYPTLPPGRLLTEF